MKSTVRSASNWIFLGVLTGVAVWFSASPGPAAAQGTQGQNGVYNSSGATVVGSSAFIDASMFATSTDTLCSAIYKILQPATYSAAVIDARGLPGNTGASMTCGGWPGPSGWID